MENKLPDKELDFINETLKKIESMGIFNEKSTWSDKDKEFLINNYSTMLYKDIAKKLNKSYSSVRSMASKLDLKKNKWKQEEIDYLKENYPNLNLSIKEIANYLNKTENSIRSYAQELGIKRPVIWTKEEDEYLIREYKNKVPVENIAKHLGRTKGAVEARIIRMELNKKNYKWTDEEIEFLKENYPNPDIPISYLAKHLGRTRDSIRYYANKKLKLTRKPNWTKEEEKYLIREYKKGVPIEEIARHLDRSERAVEVKILRIQDER